MSARGHDETTGRAIPSIFIGLLGLLIAVQACFAWLAVRSDPGVAIPNAYERGLAHNAVLREAAAADALGWRVAVENQAAADHRGTLVVRVTDAAGGALDGLMVIGLVARPTRDGLDQRFAFHGVGEGRYRANYDLPLPGLWQLDLLLDRAGATAQRSARFSAP